MVMGGVRGPLLATGPRARVGSLLSAVAEDVIGREVVVRGWLRTVRSQKSLTFLQVHDGSALGALQVVVPGAVGAPDRLSTGAAVSVTGVVKMSPGKGQTVEVEASRVDLVGSCDAQDYPLQKKRHSRDTLRRMPHLRARTNTFAAVARVRSAASLATHQFFQDRGFLHVQTPLITSLDCEGAGEMFSVSAAGGAGGGENRGEEVSNGAPGTTGDGFFGRPSYLTVSGQLPAESFACALGDVYTFGPTFRAERSHGTRHLAEFHMVEPELAFASLEDITDNLEAYVRHCAGAVLSRCGPEVDFFERFVDEGIRDRLGAVAEVGHGPEGGVAATTGGGDGQPRPGAFARVSYTEAVGLLREEIARDPTQWEHADLAWGDDLKTEHERFIAEAVFKGPTFVFNYPSALKPFYMRENGDASDPGPTVAAVDLLVPGMGELAGGRWVGHWVARTVT